MIHLYQIDYLYEAFFIALTHRLFYEFPANRKIIETIPADLMEIIKIHLAYYYPEFVWPVLKDQVLPFSLPYAQLTHDGNYFVTVDANANQLKILNRDSKLLHTIKDVKNFHSMSLGDHLLAYIWGEECATPGSYKLKSPKVTIYDILSGEQLALLDLPRLNALTKSQDIRYIKTVKIFHDFCILTTDVSIIMLKFDHTIGSYILHDHFATEGKVLAPIALTPDKQILILMELIYGKERLLIYSTITKKLEGKNSMISARPLFTEILLVANDIISLSKAKTTTYGTSIWYSSFFLENLTSVNEVVNFRNSFVDKCIEIPRFDFAQNCSRNAHIGLRKCKIGDERRNNCLELRRLYEDQDPEITTISQFDANTALLEMSISLDRTMIMLNYMPAKLLVLDFKPALKKLSLTQLLTLIFPEQSAQNT